MRVLIILFLTVSILGCKKHFEEGPYLSLSSKNNRLRGIWQLQHYFIDKQDSINFFNEFFKSKCNFVIKPQTENGEHSPGKLIIEWGNSLDTTQRSIRFVKNYYGKYFYGEINEWESGGTIYPQKNNYSNYAFGAWLYEERSFDIRYLNEDKMVLEMLTHKGIQQRMEFNKTSI